MERASGTRGGVGNARSAAGASGRFDARQHHQTEHDAPSPCSHRQHQQRRPVCWTGCCVSLVTSHRPPCSAAAVFSWQHRCSRPSGRTTTLDVGPRCSIRPSVSWSPPSGRSDQLNPRLQRPLSTPVDTASFTTEPSQELVAAGREIISFYAAN